MLSTRTCIELASLIENLTAAEIDRIFVVFGLKVHLFPPDPSFTKPRKATVLLEKIQVSSLEGPFTNSFQMDTLQYVVDHFYRNKRKGNISSTRIYDWGNFEEEVPFEDLFSNEYPALTNSLKRDGYIIKERLIRKSLPEEIVEAKTENELEKMLDKFGFKTSKTHLEQAILNHAQGKWAGANAQFRTFVESLLIEIANSLIQGRSCTTAGDAITGLSNSTVLNPTFLSESLNEVHTSRNGIEIGFVNGLWKRLHPEGSHPGLSDEEDCTFRYHISIVFAHYLLNRLVAR